MSHEPGTRADRVITYDALEAWHGHDEKVKAGQEALYHRLRGNGAASQGRYTEEMETASAASGRAGEWEDD